MHLIMPCASPRCATASHMSDQDKLCYRLNGTLKQTNNNYLTSRQPLAASQSSSASHTLIYTGGCAPGDRTHIASCSRSSCYRSKIAIEGRDTLSFVVQYGVANAFISALLKMFGPLVSCTVTKLMSLPCTVVSDSESNYRAFKKVGENKLSCDQLRWYLPKLQKQFVRFMQITSN